MNAVIFDMDGVISDTQQLGAEIESRIFKKHGLNISPEYCTEKYAGTSHIDMFTKEFKTHNIKVDIDKLVKETYVELMASEDLVMPIDGIFELIDMLEKNGFILAVASGSRPEFIDMVLKRLKLKDRFKAIVSSIEVPKGKPAPDIFLHAAYKLNANPKDCIVIEDGVNGMIAARNAGMRCIALVSKDGDYPAYKIVRSLQELSIEDFY